jgi:hypothetical protein
MVHVDTSQIAAWTQCCRQRILTVLYQLSSKNSEPITSSIHATARMGTTRTRASSPERVCSNVRSRKRTEKALT